MALPKYTHLGFYSFLFINVEMSSLVVLYMHIMNFSYFLNTNTLPLPLKPFLSITEREHIHINRQNVHTQQIK